MIDSVFWNRVHFKRFQLLKTRVYELPTKGLEDPLETMSYLRFGRKDV